MNRKSFPTRKNCCTYLYNVYGSSCLIATSEICVRFNPNCICDTFHQRKIMKGGICNKMESRSKSLG